MARYISTLGGRSALKQAQGSGGLLLLPWLELD
jgi:hypothetical protein